MGHRIAAASVSSNAEKLPHQTLGIPAYALHSGRIRAPPSESTLSLVSRVGAYTLIPNRSGARISPWGSVLPRSPRTSGHGKRDRLRNISKIALAKAERPPIVVGP